MTAALAASRVLFAFRMFPVNSKSGSPDNAKSSEDIFSKTQSLGTSPVILMNLLGGMFSRYKRYHLKKIFLSVTNFLLRIKLNLTLPCATTISAFLAGAVGSIEDSTPDV